MKPKIIHFIYDLGRGGAENILAQILPALKDFDNYIVTFTDRNDFGNEIEATQIFCLHTPGIWRIPVAIIRLRKIIKRLRPALVHSQLTLPNIVARFATPKKIPLFTSIQNSVKYNVEFKKSFIRLLEKKSLAFRNSHLIFVANSVKQDYDSFLNVLPQQYSILYNFVNTQKFFRNINHKKTGNIFKIISVGSLSYQKNFEFLINSFLKANIPNIELHIYGEGPMRQKLEQLIHPHGDKIRLKGIRKNIEEIINDYDLYVSSSLYEGLSLSVLEAMAAGVPVLLTDIPSFKEQCEDTACYYEVNNTNDFIDKLKFVISHPDIIESNSQNAIKRVEKFYKLENYTEQLKKIYAQSILQNNSNNL